MTLFNKYAPNIGAFKYINQILTDIKGEIDQKTIIIDFKTPLTLMGKSSREKIDNTTDILNDTTFYGTKQASVNLRG